MKTRTLFVAILRVLLVSSFSLSQELSPEKPRTVEPNPIQHYLSARSRTVEPNPTQLSPSGHSGNSSKSELVTEIITVEYFPVDELRTLILNIFRIDKVYSDRRSNRLILQTTKEQINDVLALIEKLDVADSELAGTEAIQNLVYRIYMLEIPSKDQDMKPFSMILQASPQLSSIELLDATKGKDLQISEFHLSDERQGEQKIEILIQGKAASNESIKQMVERIPESQIKELKWDDYESFTNNIAAAQYTRLPEQLQKHIQKFLGQDIQTIGYWFGSSSVPGDIEAPIGPWTLDLRLNAELDLTSDLRIKVEVHKKEVSSFHRRLGRLPEYEILSNTIKAEIGKPIIVGYNRKSYGTRKMGALVILPEEISVLP